jgi:serine/threonine protein kinase
MKTHSLCICTAAPGTGQVFACTQSQVWECVHRNSGIRRCVKIVELDTLTAAERASCQREIALLRKLQGHEGIITLKEVFMNRKAHIVMELATGGNLLSRVIQQETLPEDQVRRIAVSVLKALKHLQSFDLCHNDLQPSNLVLNGMDDVVLIDFGRACENGAALDYSALYTSYTSPEILNVNTCTPVSDVWSLGAIVWFCFFGQAPVPYSKRRAELTFPYCENVSRQAKQFMVACLHHDPTVRLTVEEALAHPWLQQDVEPKSSKFSWKLWWRKWFCKKEPSNDILTPSTSSSSGIGLSTFSFPFRS